MASNRHFARIILMQSLYEWLNREGDLLPIVKRNIEQHEFEANNLDFIEKIAKGVESHKEEIDNIITIAAPEWPLSQIAQVDLSVLRLAIFELIFDDEVPPKAVINEAVELSKAFGGENSSKFVNGVLGTVYRTSGKYQDEPKTETDREETKAAIEIQPTTKPKSSTKKPRKPKV